MSWFLAPLVYLMVPYSHPYVTGLSLVLGLYTYGLEGDFSLTGLGVFLPVFGNRRSSGSFDCVSELDHFVDLEGRKSRMSIN